ncbi:c-type cytochrome [Stutzerimonas urumqiensis]|uniref:c-type cytochrome n=1 Tax=Stutzerimonas urumqiensis TaxID=638269 RepID=UPI003BAC55C2
MKKVLIPLLAIGGFVAMQSASAATGEELFKSKACAACHAIDTKLVGPSYKEVAAKYSGQADAVSTLVTSIKNGSQGKWGPIPMPPNQVTDEEAKTLAEWILSLK